MRYAVLGPTVATENWEAGCQLLKSKSEANQVAGTCQCKAYVLALPIAVPVQADEALELPVSVTQFTSERGAM